MICARQLDSIPLWNASTNICLWNQSYEIGRCQVFSCQNGTSTKCLEERFKEFSAKKPLVLKSPETNSKGKMLSIKITFAFEQICKFWSLVVLPTLEK